MDSIINFSPIPKDALYEKIGEPIFGSISSDEDEDMDEDEVIDESAEELDADLDDSDFLEEEDVPSKKDQD